MGTGHSTPIPVWAAKRCFDTPGQLKNRPTEMSFVTQLDSNVDGGATGRG